MIHIDPASSEFESLPRQEQARIYLSIGWTREAVLEEFGIVERTLQRWLSPAQQKAQTEALRAWRKKKGTEWQRNWRKTPVGRACYERQLARQREKYALRRSQSLTGGQ